MRKQFHHVVIAILCGAIVTSAVAGEFKNAPITSLNEFKRFLQQTPDFPLNCLPLDAKRRFLGNLQFRDDKLVGFGTGELRYGNFSVTELQQIFTLLNYPVLESLLKNARPETQSESCRAAKTVSDISRRFDTFSAVVSKLNNERKLGAAITPAALNGNLAQKIAAEYRATFAADLTKNSLRHHSNADLTLLFRAAYIGSFYTHESIYRHDMLCVLAELERRGEARQIHFSTMYETLIADRVFTQAREFSQAHPGVNVNQLPEIRLADDLDSSKASILVITADKQTITRQNFDFDKPAQVVVIASPYCHFCEYAIRDIQTDPELREIFQQYASWLAPPEHGFDIADYQQWNRDCPGRMTAMIYNADEWPKLALWSTPTFYFFKHGEVVAKLSGWSNEGNRAGLMEGLRRIGLVQ